MDSLNLLLISWHDLGCHLGCYGRTDAPSPNIDLLATEGVRLDRFFATSSICSPSRGSMLTGLYPHQNGLEGLTHDGWQIRANVCMLEDYFTADGRHTAIVGHQHERKPATDSRCDDLWIESSQANDVAPEVCRRLETYAKDGRKFSLRTGFFEVHRPLAAESDEGWETLDPLPFFRDSPVHRQQLAKFHSAIRRADAAVGMILETLQRTGLADNTLVVFTTDHGVPFPGAKQTLYDPGLRVACILRAPGRIAAGQVASGLWSGVDLLPTILELCGVPGDQSCGKSFAPAITAKTPHNGREAIFAERSLPHLMRAIRTDRFKYIVNFDRLPGSHRIMGGEDLIAGLGACLPDNLLRKTATEELYDLSSDPLEQNNLSADPAFAQTRRELLTQLVDWMRSTDDPVANGVIRNPAQDAALALVMDPTLHKK